ncbi:NAD(P)-binding protein [Aspergillus heteromorphus CBS 117.55]|uniref:NAD(P)-binding protein n=1 Tax=Aspergillus heteromorphus CBS 117.55 TaxID=1448321 RepID=A0A317V2Z6_9EURO|nr:NAD(P)-binding protein [Aspergillus heteromorphus CBS 117.55]PWY67172.1 NAD(P)-binding protein [Aspergillus heteromorphus CBS 117.55]
MTAKPSFRWANVFILGRREGVLRETASLSTKSSIIPVTADISSKESLQAAEDTIAAQAGHAPSLSEVRDHLWSFPMEEFSRVMDINVPGTYFTVLAFLPLLEAANQRRPAPVQNQPSAPTAQKAPTNHLIKLLSTTFTPYHLRVNGLAPGLYFSEMTSGSFGDSDSGVSDGSFPPEMVPLTRAGSEQEIAGIILWMASPSGGLHSGNITVADGGRLSTLPCTY